MRVMNRINLFIGNLLFFLPLHDWESGRLVLVLKTTTGPIWFPQNPFYFVEKRTGNDVQGECLGRYKIINDQNSTTYLIL
jgi:hypothetical protein